MTAASLNPTEKLAIVALTILALTAINSHVPILKIFTGPGGLSRLITLVVVLANYKTLPFVWHMRVFNALFTHFIIPRNFDNKAASFKASVPALFQPTISSSYSPLTECDYNLHKSNATYFTDLDVTRIQLLSCLLHEGVSKLRSNPGMVVAPDGTKAKGGFALVLGAVNCNFKREIKPYEKYEMWTRVLCWDRKWLYVVTHFVKAGAVVPSGHTLDTGASFWSMSGSSPTVGVNSSYTPDAEIQKSIFATAISKYVMKLGRLTIHPEMVLNASGLLPQKPGGWNTMDGGANVNPAEFEDETPKSVIVDEEEWDWQRIESENQRGSMYAEHFAALDELHGEFDPEGGPALGVYNDLF